MINESNNKILVLDANQRSALAATRSLGKQNLTVYTADTNKQTLAGSSKYSKKSITYICPNQYPKDFIDSLSTLCQEESITHIYPMTEITFTLVTQNIALFSEQKIPFPSHSTIEKLSNKINLFKLAKQLNLPIPRTSFVSQEQSTLQACIEFNQYPLVLKPYKSRILVDNNWVITEVKIVKDEDELKHTLEHNPYLEQHPMMIQSYIDGYGSGVFSLYNNGKSTTFFSHKRLREKPPGGGVSVLSQSIAVEPKSLEIAKKLLDAANWHGVAMVEFRVDNDTGVPYLMEINTRFWGSLQLSIDAGIDFPFLLYKITQSEKMPDSISYFPGNKLRWFLGDLDSLYLTLKSESYSLKDKVKAFFKFLIPNPTTRHEIFRFEDPAPGFYELKGYIKSFFN